MKSYSATIQIKPLQQYFNIVLFISNAILTFDSMDEILQCKHSQNLFSSTFINGIWTFRLISTLAPSGSEKVYA